VWSVVFECLVNVWNCLRYVGIESDVKPNQQNAWKGGFHLIRLALKFELLSKRLYLMINI